jgi:WD40 repeat protein
MKHMNVVLLLLVGNVIVAMETQHKSSMVAMRSDGSDKLRWRVDKEMQFCNGKNNVAKMLKYKNLLRSVWFDDAGTKIIAFPSNDNCTACVWSRDGKELERLDDDAFNKSCDGKDKWIDKFLSSGNYPWFHQYEEDVSKLLEKRFGLCTMMCKNEEQLFVVPKFRIYGGHEVHAWDKENDKILFTLKHYDTVQSVDFNSKGTEIITASSDKSVRLWDAKTGKELMCIGYDTRVTSASFNQDGTEIVVATDDGKIRVLVQQEAK